MVNQFAIKHLQKLNSETLQALAEVVSRLDASAYTKVSLKGNASIGQHVRHTIEFYQCLFTANNTVNYDLRERDSLIESSPVHAVKALTELLETLAASDEDRTIVLETVQSQSDGQRELKIPSSYSRELFNVLEHAIHHMALIRVLVKDILPEFQLDEKFGVAHSTLAYRERLACQ